VDAAFPPAGVLKTSFITVNPDYTTEVSTYGSPTEEDVILRLPARKSGYYAQVHFQSLNLRPSVRSVTVQAVVPGIMTQTRK
jgi:hypothetical protein